MYGLAVSPVGLWSRRHSCCWSGFRWPARSPSGSTCPTGSCSCCTLLCRPCRAAVPEARDTWATTSSDRCTCRRSSSPTWPLGLLVRPCCARPWPASAAGRRSRTALRPPPARDNEKKTRIIHYFYFVFT